MFTVSQKTEKENAKRNGVTSTVWKQMSIKHILALICICSISCEEADDYLLEESSETGEDDVTMSEEEAIASEASSAEFYMEQSQSDDDNNVSATFQEYGITDSDWYKDHLQGTKLTYTAGWRPSDFDNGNVENFYPDNLYIQIKTRTGTRDYAGTNKTPFLKLYLYLDTDMDGDGDKWELFNLLLDNPSKDDFVDGAIDTFLFKVRPWHGSADVRVVGTWGYLGTAFTDGWYVETVDIRVYRKWEYIVDMDWWVVEDEDPFAEDMICYWEEYYHMLSRSRNYDEPAAWVDNDLKYSIPSPTERVWLNSGEVDMATITWEYDTIEETDCL